MKYDRFGRAESDSEQLHGGAGGVELPYHRAERLRREAEQEAARKAALEESYQEAARKAASINELIAQNPPTEAELREYLRLQEKEADRYIERDDPEYPTWEAIQNLLPFTGLQAEDFLEKVRINP